MLCIYVAIYALEYSLKSFGTIRVAKVVRMDLEDYFGQKWSQTMSGLHIKRICMLVDLSETDSVIVFFSSKFKVDITYIAWFRKTI